MTTRTSTIFLVFTHALLMLIRELMVELFDVNFLRFDSLAELDSFSRQLSAEFEEFFAGHGKGIKNEKVCADVWSRATIRALPDAYHQQ